MKKEYDESLCKDFPNLYVRRTLSPQQSCMGRGFSCDNGWYNLIRELSEKLEGIILNLPEQDRFCAEQVKQKFGRLEVYLNKSVPDHVDQLIDEARSKSYNTCEKCGDVGSLRTGRNYIQTLCDKHDNELWLKLEPEERLQQQQRIKRNIKLLEKQIVEYEGQLRNKREYAEQRILDQLKKQLSNSIALYDKLKVLYAKPKRDSETRG